jgi:4-amino-4-deoxy-L-arabinose transferase
VRKGNYTVAVLLLMLAGFALRLFAAADLFLHPWDEVFHALASKHMMQHPMIPTLYDTPLLPYDYRNWTGNYIWVHKQPLPLWSMAASMFLFGVNEIALRLPSVILTTLGIGLTFYIGNYFFDKKTGYLAAFFYAINGLIIEMTAGRVPTDHIDDFFLFFVEAAVFFTILFSQKKTLVYNLLTALMLGCAILSKWLPALIVLPIWLLIILDSRNFSFRSIVLHFTVLIAVTVSVFAPWQIYIRYAFPVESAWEAGYNMKHILEVLDKQGGPIYFYLDKIRINYGELIYLPLIWLTWTAFKDIRNMKRLALFIWFFVPVLFFSLIKTKMQGYILFACPAIFIAAAAFWHMLNEHKQNISLDKKKLKWLITLILLLLIALPVRYGIERIKPLKKDRNPQWVIDLKKMEQRKMTKGVLFNYQKPIDAMFYTDLTVYPFTPDKNAIDSLQQKGYTIMINDNGQVPEDIRALKNITMLHLASAN